LCPRAADGSIVSWSGSSKPRGRLDGEFYGGHSILSAGVVRRQCFVPFTPRRCGRFQSDN